MKKIYLFLFILNLTFIVNGQKDATFLNQNVQLKSNVLSLSSTVFSQNSVVDLGNQIIYNFSGKIDTFTVPENVNKIIITAIGAAGGTDLDSDFPGGFGALVSGEFDVIPGEKLKLLVGENPARNGGGGGSFVTDLLNNPLIIAGGGGGSGELDSPEKHGSITESGGKGGGTGGDGGMNGNGGLANGSGYQSGAGGGFFTNGANGNSPMIGGTAFVNGGIRLLTGGYGDGGFGGGGTGSGYVVGGGGGGYSGGGAAGNGTGGGVGGGGASFNTGNKKNFIAQHSSGHGQIIIELIENNTCPGNITVENDSGKCGAIVSFTVTAPEKGSAVQTGGLPSGTEFPLGTTTNTFDLTDSLGIESTCSFTVTVEDSELPVVNCPEDIVVSNDPGECGAVVSFSTLVDEVLIDEVLPGNISDWEVYDYPNNPTFYYQEITSPFDGTTAIKTSAVGNTIMYCSTESLTKIYDISGNTDITKLKAYLEFYSNLTTYNFPYITVELKDNNDALLGYHVYYGKDMVGSWYLNNHISANPAFYTELPSATGDMILDLSEIGENIDFEKISIRLSNYTCVGENSITFDHLRVVNGSLENGAENNGPVASDNCPGVQVEASIPSGSLFPIGTTPVTLTATDAAGNTTTCSFNITVNDTEAPVAICKSGGNGNVLLLWDIDNENTQTLKTALENEGYNVTMPTVPEYQWDNTNPSLEGFDAVIHLNGETWTSSLPLAAQNALVDFVTIEGKTFIHTEWDAYEIDDTNDQTAMSEIVILQRYTGNTSDLIYTVVNGKESHPVLKDIPTSFTISNVGYSPSNLRSYASNPAEMLMTDQYGTAAVAVRDFGSGKVIGFNHAGNYYGSDALSNTMVQQLFINALNWAGKNEYQLDNNGQVSITPEDIDGGSTDNCDITSLELDRSNFTIADIGDQEVTLTVTDNSGHSSTCTTIVKILPPVQSVPEMVCNPIDIVLDENGNYKLDSLDVLKIADGTTDLSTPFEDLILSVYPDTFNCANVNNPVFVRLTAMNKDYQKARCWAMVTVHDSTPPTISGTNIELSLNETGQAILTTQMVADSTVFDACGVDTTSLDKSIFTCDDLGENTVVLTATDVHGNMATDTILVTITDSQVPVVEPVTDLEITVAPGVCWTTIEYPVPVINDNCTYTLTQTGGLGHDAQFPIGTTTESWIVTDAAGNSAEIEFNVIIIASNALPLVDTPSEVTQDEDTPEIIIPITGISYGNDCKNQTVELTAVSDNNELISEIEVAYTDGESEAELKLTIAPDMNGTAKVTLTVKDEMEGMIYKTFNINILPINDAPVVVKQVEDQIVNASYVLKVPVSSALGELFDDVDGDVLTLTAMMENGTPLPAWAELVGDELICSPMIEDKGNYTVVVKATDPDGASATDTFVVIVDGYPVSTPSIDAGFDIAMYPNPTAGRVQIELKNSGSKIKIAVFSITGSEVFRNTYYNTHLINLNMSDKGSGVYLVKINVDSENVIKKLVVDKK